MKKLGSSKIIFGMFFIAVLAAALLGTFYMREAGNIRTISLQEIEQPSASEEDVINIGVSAMISPKDTLTVYKEIVDYIGEKMGKRAKIVQRKTYAEMNDLVKNKEVLAAFVCSGPYVSGNEEFGMELIAAPQMYNETVYYSYIIVNKDGPIKSFEELRGKKFAFTDPKSNTGKIVPTYILAKMNETPNSFFSDYTFTGSHDNSIKAVAQKLVDGAAVDHLIWEYLNKKNPEFTSQTKVIDKLGPYCMPPLVMHPETENSTKSELRNIVLNMDKNEKGKKILEKIFIDKFVTVEHKCYDSVREMEYYIKNMK